jgi:hypothetical protein
MYTAGSEIDLNDSLCFQVFRVKRDFLLLLFSIGFNQKRIAEIIVMKVKCRLVVSVSIGLDDLSVRDPCIFDEHIYIYAAVSICSTDKPFDCKPMVGFMRRRGNRR